MRTISSVFVVRGRYTEYPAKERIVKRLKSGEKPILSLCRDEDGYIVLINPDTGEEVGQIPPCPHYEDDYDLLECFIDLGFAIDVIAISTTKKTHYKARVSVHTE